MPTISRLPQVLPTPLCLTLSSPIQQRPITTSSLFLFNFRPKRFHFLKPCSSLRETKKQLSKVPTNAPPPKGLNRLLNLSPKDDNSDNSDDGESESGDTALKGTILAGLLLVGIVGGFGTVGYIYKDQINAFLNQFSGFIEGKSSSWALVFVCSLVHDPI